jgi:hypothetical protein
LILARDAHECFPEIAAFQHEMTDESHAAEQPAEQSAQPGAQCVARGMRACFDLRKATRAVSRMYDDVLRDTGLNITQFSLLRLIRTEKELSVSTLGRYTVMDRTTIIRALAPLQRDRRLLRDTTRSQATGGGVVGCCVDVIDRSLPKAPGLRSSMS